jgi:hypothetical protein
MMPVDHAAEQALADGDVHDGAGALDDIAFLDLGVRAEDHDADIVGFEVERHALHAVRELDHFAGLDVVQTVDAGDTVADAEHASDFGYLRIRAKIGDLILDNLGDFCGTNVHENVSLSSLG